MTETSIVPVMEAAIPGTTRPIEHYLPSIAQLSNCPHCARNIAIHLMYMKAEIEDENDDDSEVTIDAEEECIQSPETVNRLCSEQHQSSNMIILSSDDDDLERAHAERGINKDNEWVDTDLFNSDFVLHLDEEHSSCESGADDGKLLPEVTERQKSEESSVNRDAGITKHSTDIPPLEAHPGNVLQGNGANVTSQTSICGDLTHPSQSSSSVECTGTRLPCDTSSVKTSSDSLVLNASTNISVPFVSKQSQSALSRSTEVCQEKEPDGIPTSAKNETSGLLESGMYVFDDCVWYVEDEADSNNESSDEEWSHKSKPVMKTHFLCRWCKKSFSSPYFLRKHRNSGDCTGKTVSTKPHKEVKPDKETHPDNETSPAAKKCKPVASAESQPKLNVTAPPEFFSETGLPDPVPLPQLHVPNMVQSSQIVLLDITSGGRQKVIGFSCSLCNKILPTHLELVQHLMFTHQCQIPNLQTELGQESIEINLKLNIASGTQPPSRPSQNRSKGSKPNQFAESPISSNTRPLRGLKASSKSNAKCYLCNICSRACMSNHHLALHMRSHTGSRPYKCDYCNKQYASKGYLCRHLRFCKPK